ncbi:MAG: DUF3052 family protein [Ktedonobacterales bacterium]
MAGYSGTPLVKKLGIKPGARVALADPPPGFAATLGPLPPAATILPRPGEPADVILCFVTTRSQLTERFGAFARSLDPAGGLWVAWPKQAARVPTDLSEHVVREMGLAAGLVDNKVCAIDDIWSGLRFVVRLADRSQWPRR